MRKIIKAKRNKTICKTLLIFVTLITACLTIAYSAFQTNISITTKGNITTTPSTCFIVSDNGDGTGTITDYDSSCGSKVKIPSYINNLKIIKIDDGSAVDGIHGPFVNKGITKLILPNTLTYIGSHAFCGNKIDYLEIPSSVKEIADHAFAWTYSFSKGLVLNEGLETIGIGAFECCGLKSLILPSTVKNLYVTIASSNAIEGDNAFIYARDENGNIDKTTLISFGNATRKEVVVPDNVETIITAAFVSDWGVEEITIPDSVKTIQSWAFWSMNSFKTVNIGNNVTSIADQAFHETPNLTTININKEKDSLAYSPWGATNATVNWAG